MAHNVEIGKDCALTAGAVIGGSTIIGDTCWLGLNSTVKHKLKMGNNVIVGSGASVIHDVPDEDIVAGVPAKSIKLPPSNYSLWEDTKIIIEEKGIRGLYRYLDMHC